MKLWHALVGVVCAGCASTIEGLQGDGGVHDTGAIDIPIAHDVNAVDIVAMVDAGTMDVPAATIDVSDAGSPMDIQIIDAGPSCGPLPDGTVPASPADPMIADFHAFAFDGMGGIAMAGFENVLWYPTPTGLGTYIAGLPGSVLAMCFSVLDTVVMLFDTSPDGETGVTGQVGWMSVMDGPLHITVPTINTPGGIAVDAAGYLWFTDRGAGTVSRVSLADPGAVPSVVVTGIAAPSLLAFDATGSYLYVTCARPGFYGNLFIVPLARSDGGATVTAFSWSEIDLHLGDMPQPLTGIAVDVCGNVYLADVSNSHIWRVKPPPDYTYTEIVSNVMAPTGLAFGQGPGIANTTLFTLDTTGSLYGASVGVQGVPLPAP